jgi:hypothetical protein
MKITHTKRWFTALALALVTALGASAQTASFTTTTTNFDPAGGTVTFDVSFNYTGQSLSTLGLNVTLPTGWSFASASGANTPPIVPDSGTTSAAEFAYFSIPANAISFSVVLNYGSGLTVDQVISGVVIYKVSGNSTELNANLGPVTVAAPPVAPAITAQPESLTVNEGTSASFTVAASGNPTPSFQWKKDGTDIDGATSATYSISVVSAVDAGSYTAVVTNSVSSVTSAAATLSVNAAPTISSQPVSATVNQGQDVSFSVTAAGAVPLTYQWLKDGSPLSGETNVTLQLTGVQSGNEGSYTVVVSNSVSSVTSSAATLAVIVPPTISTQPATQTIDAGAAVAFSVGVSGTAPFTYQWSKDASPISGATSATFNIASAAAGDAGAYSVAVTNAAAFVSSENAVLTVEFLPVITSQPTDQTASVGGSVTFTVQADAVPTATYQWRRAGSAITGETGASLTLSSLQASDNSATFDVVITNTEGATTSVSVSLTVNEGAVITVQPESTTANEGSPASFSVTATGNPAPTYQWRKDGTDITGATSATLNFSATNRSDADNYTVVVANEFATATSDLATLVVQFAPEITEQPSDRTGSVNGSATIQVTAIGIPTPTYQWRRGGTDLNGETGASLTLSALQTSDNGATFDVVITNLVDTVTSAAVTLTVNEGAAITVQPEGTTANEGSPASFSVTATGNPVPTYQWQKDGTDITGATSATLNFSATNRTDAANYTVVVANEFATVTSEPATLDVLFNAEISQQPIDGTGSVGGSVSFEVAAIGNPTPTYQWFRGTTAISDATSATLSLPSLLLSDNGASFYVEVSNSANPLQSTVVTLTVNEGAAISTQPQSVTVTEGLAASFSVVATGNPAPTYQWMKGGVAISGATAATLEFTTTARADSGLYTVVVDNGVGTATSDPATLDVQFAPEITTQPVDVAAGVGGSATFTGVGIGNPSPTLQWFRNGSPISGATAASVTVTGLVLGESGDTFYVIGTNILNTVQSSTATLTVREIPVVTLQPVGGTVNAGGSFTFTVDATGTPTPTYQWRKDGAAISGATAKTLALSGLAGSDAGSYDVVVSNAQGSATSSAAALVVPTPPTITTAPVGSNKVVGESFTVTVAVDGTAPFSYQWAKDGSSISGATSASFVIPTLTISDAGSYTVTVTNAVASTTSTGADLVVDNALKAPTITTQPIDTSVRSGTTATFRVVASGNPVPTYQWLKNNAPIAGQTGASLTISNAQAADEASYSVVLTNTQGTTSSSLVSLTVTSADVAPVITSQPRDAIVGLDTAVTFSVGATAVPEPTYQWLKNGSAITGATSASFTIPSTALSDAGTFSVIVTNSAGDVTSRNASLRVLEISYEGTYFGSFGEGRGQFAITIFADNTGVFLGFDSISGLFVQGTVSVATDGTFTLQADTPTTTTAAGGRQPAADQSDVVVDGSLPDVGRAVVVFSAKIESDGSVDGTVTGVAGLSMTAAKEEGSTASAGYYQASSGGSDDSTFTIVAPSGKVIVVAKTATGGDAGVGTASDSGAITVTTVKNQTVTATVSAGASTIEAEVTSSTGAKTSFTGGSAEVIATQRLVNISSRAVAGSGSEQTIAGIVITGQDSKPVLIRAIGPGLSGFGVTGVLAAPKLELFQGQSVIASNTGWTTAGKTAQIVASASVVGAFALDTASADSVLLETLAPGAYTAIAGGSDGGSGVVLIEVYDLSTPTAGQKLFNISTRAAVGSGDGTVVVGFVVSGSVPKRVLLRGAGPALAAYGLTAAMADPQIKLFKGSTQVATNDNWGTNAAAVTTASTATGAFQFAADSKDAAMVISLDPGAYTVQLSGVGGGAGIGLIEVYEIP